MLDPTRAMLRRLIELPRAMKSRMLAFLLKREKLLMLNAEPRLQKSTIEAVPLARTKLLTLTELPR
jgi:hypothetical protein